MTGSRSRLVDRPLPIDDPRRRKPDIVRALELLGWEPKVDLETGLEATIAWFAGTSADDQPRWRGMVERSLPQPLVAAAE
jgi:UDP-glucuronate decarboxylase